MKQYERRTDERGQPYLATDLPGFFLTRLPLLNKSTAFTLEERETFGLEGLLPPHVATLEQQLVRTYANYLRSASNIDRHVYLRTLQDRNEVLFHALVEEHLEEMLPIIYTPTVAEAVQRFSHLYRYPRGIVVSTENIDHVDRVLANAPMPDVRLAVATDSEGILGIGDQGYGGMGICIGKLALYTAGAGIDPAVTLPIELDVGTNRADLLDDPLYLGVRHERLTGQPYDDFIERFATAFKRRFPRALLQWEDFSKQKAFDVLARFQGVLPSFNDDIQGTGAVVLSGLLAASRKTKRPLLDEVILVHGAGAGGVGVANQVVAGLVRQGASDAEARSKVFLIDSRGLVLADRAGLEAYKLHLAHDPAEVAGWRVAGAIPTMLETVRQAEVTVLLGLSGQRGAFNREVVEAVAANTPSPLVFALSNPTDNSEAVPEDVFEWSQGRAIVATGSPFPEVEYGGVRHPIGQGNNAFIFPGLGLGALMAKARQVTPGMLTAAAEALADYTDPASISAGAVYPPINALRRASKHVAAAVLAQAMAEGSATTTVEGDLDEAVAAAMWEPRYVPIR
ncbi:MAG TPA: NAD-dependent malic enzyme, partial [Trueperaceae bacterium]|nr:NAD-dependent malic enzyme [Trueperaceae bacterium]